MTRNSLSSAGVGEQQTGLGTLALLYKSGKMSEGSMSVIAKFPNQVLNEFWHGTSATATAQANLSKEKGILLATASKKRYTE